MEFIITLALLLVLLANAKIAGEICERLGYNAVLGELFLGFLLGPSFFGILDPHHEIIAFLAEVGVLFLLFEIGLESRLTALLRVGLKATRVAVIGVIFPFVFGWGMFALLGYPSLVSILVGATMTATSIGITMRVFADMKKVDTPEGRIILGAAVIDDILGLLILSVLVGLVQGGGFSLSYVLWIFLLSLFFLVGMILTGIAYIPPMTQYVSKLKTRDAVLCFSLVLAGIFGILAYEIGLAVIVGSFLCGLLLASTSHKEYLHHRVSSIATLIVPFFFLAAGAQVSLDAFMHMHSLLLISGLFVLACIGKIISGIAAHGNASSLVVGIGMIPRGEVGLIFAQYGLTYSLLDAQLYSVLVAVIVLTTFVTPIMLKKVIV